MIGEERCRGEEGQHQHSGGERLRGQIVAERQDDEFDQRGPPDGEAAVEKSEGIAVFAGSQPDECAEVVHGGEVLGDG